MHEECKICGSFREASFKILKEDPEVRQWALEKAVCETESEANGLVEM